MSWISQVVTFESRGLNRRTINGSLKGSRNSTMLSLLGNPRGNYNQDCRWPTNQSILDLVTTEDVGPFKVSGIKPAVSTLRTIFSEVKSEKPEIYNVMSHVGMLCCRYVRGSTSSISNHSWGTAIDLTLEGKLDRRGNNKVQRGLLEIYPYFNKYDFFWGAAFGTEDCMHFEASDQLMHKWAAAGEFGAIGNVDNGLIDFGDRGPEVEGLQEKLNLIMGLDMDIDGIFGPATKANVMEFQRREGLTIDGIVGPATKAALGL